MRSAPDCPTGREVFAWDAGDGSIKGFGVRMMPSGAASYLVQYRTRGGDPRTRRLTLRPGRGADARIRRASSPPPRSKACNRAPIHPVIAIAARACATCSRSASWRTYISRKGRRRNQSKKASSWATRPLECRAARQAAARRASPSPACRRHMSQNSRPMWPPAKAVPTSRPSGMAARSSMAAGAPRRAHWPSSGRCFSSPSAAG